MAKFLVDTKRLYLCLPAFEDIPAIIRYYSENQAFFAPFQPLWDAGFLTEQFWRVRLRLFEQEFIEEKAVRLFIFPKGDASRVVGNVNLTLIVRGNTHSCNLGYNLSEAAQGKGFMHEALTGVLEFAFGNLNLHRVNAQYMPRNERSGKVLKKLGFSVEGYARDYLLIAGKWEDHILTSLTNPNWKNYY